MSEKTKVTPTQMLEAMDKLVSHRLAISAIPSNTPKESEMRTEQVKRIDDTYNVLLDRMQGYTPDP